MSDLARRRELAERAKELLALALHQGAGETPRISLRIDPLSGWVIGDQFGEYARATTVEMALRYVEDLMRADF